MNKQYYKYYLLTKSFTIKTNIIQLKLLENGNSKNELRFKLITRLRNFIAMRFPLVNEDH